MVTFSYQTLFQNSEKKGQTPSNLGQSLTPQRKEEMVNKQDIF